MIVNHPVVQVSHGNEHMEGRCAKTPQLMQCLKEDVKLWRKNNRKNKTDYTKYFLMLRSGDLSPRVLLKRDQIKEDLHLKPNKQPHI